MAEIDVRQILRDLKSQRRQIDRAIVALEAVVKGTEKNPRQAVTTKQNLESLSVGNGTTGQGVPFARGLKVNGS